MLRKKIWIFSFAGSSHQNYMAYLLEVYCLLRYEASPDLRDAILNNWLVNITGELGKWIEADLLQEHYNRWLEDMVKKRGGDFDDNFYRHTLSPNVDHFLRIKEEIENAFSLTSRGKSHTSSHLHDELRVLLGLFMEENIHLFSAGRTLGHAAINHFNVGYWRLDTGKLDDFISKSTTFADVIADIIQTCQHAEDNIVPDCEPQSQSSQFNDTSDDINLSPPLSETSSSSESCSSKSASIHPSTPPSASQSTQSKDDDEDDYSTAHLVSGSDHDVYLSDNRLTHESWYEHGEEKENSSDEDDVGEDIDCGSLSDGDNSVDEDDVNSE